MTFETWPLKSYFPDAASFYCYQLWAKHGFQLKISTPRKTKLGDYRYRPKSQSHQITVNQDLNPYAFLVVYLHEVAHYCTNIKHGINTKPHGYRWQQQMRILLTPVMTNEVFPEDVLWALESYLIAPKAASGSHPDLTRALRRYDPPSDGVTLEEIPEGAEFWFKSRKYQKVKVRRTRVACIDSANHRKWLIHKMALVEPIKN